MWSLKYPGKSMMLSKAIEPVTTILTPVAPLFVVGVMVHRVGPEAPVAPDRVTTVVRVALVEFLEP
jgi:hypothetical protein